MIPADNKEAFEFSEKIKEKSQRKLDAKDNDKQSVWFGLGMMGIVGWTIVGPTLLGAVIGLWLDKRYPATFSWTLSGLIIGLFVGCLIAWRWINKEHQEINQHKKNE